MPWFPKLGKQRTSKNVAFKGVHPFSHAESQALTRTPPAWRSSVALELLEGPESPPPHRNREERSSKLSHHPTTCSLKPRCYLFIHHLGKASKLRLSCFLTNLHLFILEESTVSTCKVAYCPHTHLNARVTRSLRAKRSCSVHSTYPRSHNISLHK